MVVVYIMESSKKICFAVCSGILALSLFTAGSVQAEESVAVQENIEQLKKTKSCRGCDLSGANLTRFDLTGADLEGADLSQAKFFLADLTKANLKDTNLTGAAFGGADLSDADLRGADLRGASLDTAYLEGAQMEGEFVSIKPYEKEGVSEIEKEVYVEDVSQPKKSPGTREVQVGSRRDFGEQPPVIAEVEAVSADEKSDAPAGVAELPPASAAKKTVPPPPVVVEEEQGGDDTVETAQEMVVEEETVTEENAPVKTVEMAKESEQPAAVVQQQAPEPSEPLGELGAQADGAIEKVTAMSGDLALEKTKRDNLTRLLDRRKCYECDLSGLDLSGKKLKFADLEKANLSGCNLEKVDLRKANLKGARLVGANLKNARLDKADFYKADLTSADLTGAQIRKTLFDNATLTGTIGYEGDGALWKAGDSL